MATSIGLNLLNFFNFIAFETEKFRFKPKNRARTAKLSVPIGSSGKNRSKYLCTLDMWENFFGTAVRHVSKLFVVKKSDKNLSD